MKGPRLTGWRPDRHSSPFPGKFIVMEESIKISVVIATYNRSDIIRMTLRCLAEQTLNPLEFEVIIVDDGSSDGTEAAVEEMKPVLPYKLTYLKHANRGISFTQNRGIRAAVAPIVCLIADDIHLDPGALEEHVRDHEMNPGPNIAVLGKVIQSPVLGQSVFLKVWDPFRFRELEDRRELPCYFFFACNISCKRAFLLGNGLFNETLVKEGAYAHEDVELGYRLEKKGLRIFYNKKALGYHYHLVTLDQAMKTAYKKGLAWVRFRMCIGKPEITIRYHVLQYRFLKDYREVFRRHNNLMGLDSNPARLFISQVIRITLFNFLTIPVFWLPVMKKAEQNPVFARFMHRLFYRCVISYHFHKGVADQCRARIQSPGG